MPISLETLYVVAISGLDFMGLILQHGINCKAYLYFEVGGAKWRWIKSINLKKY